MISDTEIATPTPHAGTIRMLRPHDLPLLRAHLLRLDSESRRLRFNGIVGDAFLERYSATCFEQGVIVIAYVEDGAVHGAAELHPPHRSADMTPEIAFSVEDRVRRHGVGSALFKALLVEAKRRGHARLRVTTGAQNDAMRALARKFGAKLSFSDGELSGTLDLEQVKPARLGLTPFEIGRDVTRAMVGFNYALWTPILKMYGVTPPRPQFLPAREQA